jgi:hypothetical protein
MQAYAHPGIRFQKGTEAALGDDGGGGEGGGSGMCSPASCNILRSFLRSLLLAMAGRTLTT